MAIWCIRISNGEDWVERGCRCVNHRRSLLDFIPSPAVPFEVVRWARARAECTVTMLPSHQKGSVLRETWKEGRSGFLILNNWNMIRNLLGSERFPAIPLSVWGVRERPKSHIDLGQSSPADKLRRCPGSRADDKKSEGGSQLPDEPAGSSRCAPSFHSRTNKKSKSHKDTLKLSILTTVFYPLYIYSICKIHYIYIYTYVCKIHYIIYLIYTNDLYSQLYYTSTITP